MRRAAILAILALVACGQTGAVDAPAEHQRYGDQFGPNPIPVGGIPIFNAVTYGATGNGTTDDRAAIQSAINAACSASAGRVYLPYTATGYLTVPTSNTWDLQINCSNVELFGDPGTTLLMGGNSTSKFLIETENVNNVYIHDLTLDGEWQNGYTSEFFSGIGFKSLSLSAGTWNTTTYNTGTVATHPFNTGDGPFTLGTLGTLPTGLSTGTSYWVIKINGSTIEFASSQANALSNTPLTGFSAGTGNSYIQQQLVLPQQTLYVQSTNGSVYESTAFPSTGSNTLEVATTSGATTIVNCTGTTSTSFTGCTGGVGTIVRGLGVGILGANPNPSTGFAYSSANTLVTTGTGPPNHGWVTGTGPITVSNTGGSLPTGLAAATNYWVIVVDQTHFELATSFANAEAGTPVTISAAGTGTNTTAGGPNGGLNQTYASDPQNAGIYVRGTTNIVVDHVQIHDVYGDCFQLSGSSPNVSPFVNKYTAKNIRIHNTTCDMAARDAVTLNGNTIGTDIDHVAFTNFRQGGVYAQPSSAWQRDLQIQASRITKWWDLVQAGTFSITADGAGAGDYGFSQATAIRNWRIHDNDLETPVSIFGVQDFAFDHNRLVVDTDFGGNVIGSALRVDSVSGDISITDNPVIYARNAHDNANGNCNNGVVCVSDAPSGANHYYPSRVTIARNNIQANNGLHGIEIVSAGGAISQSTVTGLTFGTSLIVTDTTMQDTTAAWTTNQWEGFMVRIGTTTALITTNTATTLTLLAADPSFPSAWTYFSGAYAAPPASGTTYTIYRDVGILTVEDNDINLANKDGRGQGGYGVLVTALTSTALGGRVTVQRNKIYDCATDAIHTTWATSGQYALLDISDNKAMDTLTSTGAATCTNVLNFSGTQTSPLKWIMGGNQALENVTNVLGTGISTGTWLRRDGSPQDWTGYGSPASAVSAPVGSTFVRLDGSTSTTLWVKETGTGNTGWTAK